MKNSGFTIINNDILRDDNLNIYEKYFLMALKSFDHKDIGEVYPTYETLMKLFGTTKRNTIAKLIKSLKDKNYIIVMKKNRANCYKFIKDYLVVNTKGDKNDNISSLKDTTTSNPKDTVNSNQEDTDINKNDKISSLKDTTTSNLKDTGNSNQEDTDINKNDNISSLKDTTTSNPGDTSNSIPVDTLKIKEKNTKEKYIIILNAWNDTDIYNEDCLNTKIKNSITMALRRHTLEEILTSIKNYQEVYYSDYYYDYTWSLQTFLVKPNGLKKFLSEGEIWTDYKATQKKPKKEEFNISDFID
ncbi:helix-turn-helix domain-containing protein [Clostridium saudiense]|nr:helix-turn-helix domain-containing protein [Clostridium saudiense]